MPSYRPTYGTVRRSELLADAVVEAVGAAPMTFIEQLPSFLRVKPEYQYAVISGFKKLWDAWDGKQVSLDWNVVWRALVDFFKSLLDSREMWEGNAKKTRLYHRPAIGSHPSSPNF